MRPEKAPETDEFSEPEPHSSHISVTLARDMSGVRSASLDLAQGISGLSSKSEPIGPARLILREIRINKPVDAEKLPFFRLIGGIRTGN